MLWHPLSPILLCLNFLSAVGCPSFATPLQCICPVRWKDLTAIVASKLLKVPDILTTLKIDDAKTYAQNVPSLISLTGCLKVTEWNVLI